MADDKIIIADDEERIRRLVADFLSIAGFQPIEAADGREALDAFAANPDTKLMILDIMMPELDGWAACRELRKTSNIPVILLTARSEEFDQLTGFEAGADEYVTKPFSPAVLVKRVEALLRRSEGQTAPADAKGLRIDADAYVAYLDGQPLELTLKEFEILNKLHETPGRSIQESSCWMPFGGMISRGIPARWIPIWPACAPSWGNMETPISKPFTVSAINWNPRGQRNGKLY